MKTCLQTIILAGALLFPLLASAREPDKAQLQQFSQSSNLSFVENAGQITDQHNKQRKDIGYKLSTRGMDIFIGEGEIHYQFLNRDSKGLRDDLAKEKDKVEVYRLDVSLVGANKNAKVIAEEQQAYYEQYYTAQAGEKGLVAHSYNKITYQEVYPNIDWVLYLKDNELKYDFVVREGGKVSDIKLQYEGANSLTIKEGALTAVTPFGSITEQKPYSYEAGTAKEIASHYILQNNILSFEAQKYEGAIVIDPVLDWATYYGNVSNDKGLDLTTDPAGNVYMVGQVTTGTNMATAGAHQTTIAGVTDGYIVKFAPNGTRLWSTYYGGTATDMINAIDYDVPSGAIYVAGKTKSTTGIATPGSYQDSYTPLTDTSEAFLAKFSNGGIRQWATYYGGAGNEEVHDVEIDPSGNVYMSGHTNSTIGLGSPGAHQSACNGSLDNFLVKFSSSGSRLWGTYYGSPQIELGGAVTCDNSGNVYLFGKTYGGTTNIATPGSHQPAFAGNSDGFLVKFDANGVRQWGTYYGGPVNEGYNSDWWDHGITFDPAGFIYITGQTNSTAGIATPGAHQTTFTPGLSDIFLAKFTLAGTRVWGTYFGGSEYDWGSSVAISPTGMVYLCGHTSSTTGIATPGAHQYNFGGDVDMFLAKFTPSGTLVESTYLGSGGWDYGGSISIAPPGHIYVCGFSSNATGTPSLATAGAHQTTWSGGDEGLLVKWLYDPTASIAQPYNDTIMCYGMAFQVPYTVTYNFNPGNIFTVEASDANGSFANPVVLGGLAATGSGVINCVPSLPPGNGYRLRIKSTNPPKTSVDNGLNIRVPPIFSIAGNSNSPVCAGGALNLTSSTSPGATYTWNGPASFSSSQQNPTISPVGVANAGSYTVSLIDTNGCVSTTATVHVNVAVPVSPTITIAVSPNDTICTGDTVTFTSTQTNGGTTPAYKWYKNSLQIPGANSATYQTNTISTGDFFSVEMTSTQPCAVPATVNSSNVIMTVVPSVVPSVTITASPGLNVGPWSMITFTATPVNEGPSPTYQWLRNGQPVIGAVSNTWGAANLSDNDVISVVLFSSEVCAIPPTDTSNALTVHINMGINDQDNNISNLQLYPNPNTGDFTIKGNFNAEDVVIEVVNAVGQIVYSMQLTVDSRSQWEHKVHLDVASGIYLLRVKSEKDVETFKFNITAE